MYLKSRKFSLFLQTQPDFVLAKDPLFSLLSDAPQELAQIEIGKGEPGIRGRAGGNKKANGISAANPHPVVKGERRPVSGRAIHQTRTRRRKHRKPFAGARCTHRAAKKREPCAANLPSLPQGAQPAARPRRKQAHAKQIIAQKQGNVAKRRILLQSCALCAQRIINARSKYIKGTAAKKKIRNKLYKDFEYIV